MAKIKWKEKQPEQEQQEINIQTMLKSIEELTKRIQLLEQKNR